MPPRTVPKLTLEDRQAVGARIRECRRAKRWSQREFGQRTDIWHTRISKLETGQATPSLAEMFLFAEALDIGLDELARGIPPADSSVERYLAPPLLELEAFGTPEECAILGKLLRVLVAGFKATRPGAPEPHSASSRASVGGSR